MAGGTAREEVSFQEILRDSGCAFCGSLIFEDGLCLECWNDEEKEVEEENERDYFND